jgi:hypothetical protein
MCSALFLAVNVPLLGLDSFALCLAALKAALCLGSLWRSFKGLF